MKELSIIIPIYNMGKYLPICLGSLAKQKFDDDVEVLLIDDGSTDNSGAICDEISRNDTHYKVIHQENQGVSAARNCGLVHSSGKYVAWIDPDDYVTDEWYSTVKKELATSPDMIFFDMYVLNNGKIKEINFDKCSRKVTKYELCCELAMDIRLHSHLWSKIIARSFFNELFPTKYSFCEDFSVLHCFCWNVENCKYVHKPLYVYRQLENSITHDENKWLKNSLLLINMHKRRYKFYRNKKIDVPQWGIYLAILGFITVYNSTDKMFATPYKKVYKVCCLMLRKKLVELIFSSEIPIKTKIKIIGIVVFSEKNYFKIKALLSNFFCRRN
ncbi:glycosyltransferase family 2 protein [Selenomonas ruminantium]|uniref:glycosyltransferase family 2 protein n=1 Tax=Selenomonas ruminantium TaxID=971 RepID=UPI0004061133|nr:glycosyltransferase [Selenomonas ruminantium]